MSDAVLSHSALASLPLPLICALLLSTVLTATIAFTAKRLGAVVPVREERWHKEPKPRYGGVAIYLSFCITLLLFTRGDYVDTWMLLLAGTAIFLLGLLDDLFDLKPYIKLIYQIAIASAVTKMGVVVAVFPDQIVAMAVSVAWIVVITNAFNLLDNMDGLSGGIAFISMLSFTVISLLRGETMMLLPATVFIGSVAGFLFFNFPPARIFMGDCGSLFLGFMIAVFSIKGTWHQASNLFLLLATPVLLLGVPIFDTLIVSLQRFMHGRPIYEGGKDHSSHRLVALGWSEKQAVLILYALASLLGIAAVVGFAMNVFIISQLVLLLMVFLLVVGMFLSEAKIYKSDLPAVPTPAAAANSNPVTTIRVPFVLHKRRMLEIVMDTILMAVAYISAYLLRFEGDITPYNWKLIQQSLPIIVPVKLLTMLASGMYSGLWKYVDFTEIKKIFLSTVLASLTSICLLVGIYRFSGFSRSLFFIDLMLFFLLVVGFRAMLRFLRESLYGFAKAGKSVLLIGAGEAGHWALEEIRKDPQKRMYPVGIIDDDPWKKGRSIHGIPVLGDRSEIERYVRQLAVEEVIIAMPSAPAKEKEKLATLCRDLGIPTLVLEGIKGWTLVPQSSPTGAAPQPRPGDNDSNRNDNSNDPPSPFGPGKLH